MTETKAKLRGWPKVYHGVISKLWCNPHPALTLPSPCPHPALTHRASLTLPSPQGDVLSAQVLNRAGQVG